MTSPPFEVSSEVCEVEEIDVEAENSAERIGVRAGIRKTGSTMKYPGVVFVDPLADEYVR